MFPECYFEQSLNKLIRRREPKFKSEIRVNWCEPHVQPFGVTDVTFVQNETFGRLKQKTAETDILRCWLTTRAATKTASLHIDIDCLKLYCREESTL